MEEKEIHDELASIRSLMERSSKFISLSGLSGILAGIYGLIGAALGYYIIYFDPNFSLEGITRRYYALTIRTGGDIADKSSVQLLVVIAIVVLLASITTGYVLTRNKAKRRGQQVWGSSSKALMFNMVVPLIAGGLLILIFVYRGYYGIVSPSCLIFYGLALISASNFTFKDVRYLGFCEIALGLIAACLPGYGLLFWAIGFGMLHIVYGSMMYFKYDR